MGYGILNGVVSFAKLGFAITLVFLMASACMDMIKMSNTDSEDLPKDAIPVKDGLYMVPINKDASGCMIYRAFSREAATASAIYYRSSDGSFVMDKSTANCR